MIYICRARIYKYGKWTFGCGMGELSPITKTGDQYKRIPNKFYEDIGVWLNLKDDDREQYRVGGGCERI